MFVNMSILCTWCLCLFGLKIPRVHTSLECLQNIYIWYVMSKDIHLSTLSKRKICEKKWWWYSIWILGNLWSSYNSEELAKVFGETYIQTQNVIYMYIFYGYNMILRVFIQLSKCFFQSANTFWQKYWKWCWSCSDWNVLIPVPVQPGCNYYTTAFKGLQVLFLPIVSRWAGASDRKKLVCAVSQKPCSVRCWYLLETLIGGLGVQCHNVILIWPLTLPSWPWV